MANLPPRLTLSSEIRCVSRPSDVPPDRFATGIDHIDVDCGEFVDGTATVRQAGREHPDSTPRA
ncbi:MAG: hypothetical protein O9972_57145 [Burkholderiales bacterium]|nr:hypothetical protein [Burkholderiales bacterium]